MPTPVRAARRRRARPTRARALGTLLALVLAGIGLVGCASDGSDAAAGRPGDGREEVRSVPSEYPTIQDAVDAARPGDLVLVSPGTYAEAVTVTTDRLVIRGTDRNRVILDGAGRLTDGISISADQVAIENLTVRSYAVNGVIFAAPYDADGDQEGPVGWRATHVTAVANGLYGLYAFGTGPGRFDANYASGHPDSGIYVGQCRDCGAVVDGNLAERNAIGYENTNASGVTVAGNVFRANRVGMTIASGDQEALAPQDGGRVVANLVIDNDDPDTPETEGGFGVGIAVAGGQGNRIERNEVRGHPGVGILLIDQAGYRPERDEVVDNDLADNAVDLAVAADGGGAPSAPDSCFAGNRPARTVPNALERLLGCSADAADLPNEPLSLPEAPKGIAPAAVQRPGDQPQLAGADAAVADQQWSAPDRSTPKLDLDAIDVPEAP